MSDPATAESRLYDLLSGWSFDDLSSETVESCVALVLDHFTCALIGLNLPWTRTLREAAVGLGGGGSPGTAVVYGEKSPVPATTAALVNGTATHGLDFDDLYFPAMSHPGCVVIPAAIATAYEQQADGRSLIVAIVAGYEMMGRVGKAVGLLSGERGFHATGHQGPLGAAVAAAKLRGADAAGIESAVGLAASFGAGIKAFQNGPGDVKRLHAGRASEAGLIAAHLAASGYDGPRQPMTSEFGFVNTYAFDGCGDAGAIGRGLNGARKELELVIDDIYIKPYAACGAVHGAVAAAEQLAQREQVTLEQVESVAVGTSRRAILQNSNPNPSDVMAAQYSTEYAVALALLGHARAARRFLEAGSGRDGDVMALAQRISLHVDERADHAYPLANEAEVVVTLGDGRALSEYGSCGATSSRGWDVAHRKFITETREILGAEAQAGLTHAIHDLPRSGRVEACLAAVADIDTTDRTIRRTLTT